MYNVSFNVSNDNSLLTALTALQSIMENAGIEKFVVTQLEEAAPAKRKNNYPKNRKAPMQANGSRFGSQRDRAALVLAQIGVKAFNIKDIKPLAKRLGVGNTALYNMIRAETEAGRLTHVGYGKLQRTVFSFAESLGVLPEAVNQ